VPGRVATVPDSCPAAVASRVVGFVRAELRRRPLSGIPDLYKLVYQGVSGPAHAVPSREEAAAWLRREVTGLGALSPRERMIEPLPPDGSFVRVNLRPWIQSGRDPRELLDLFLSSASAARTDEDRRRTEMRSIGGCLVRAAARGELPFRQAELARWWAEREAEGFPAVHHGGAYETAYHPAYRVILRRLLRETPEASPSRSGR
jgi:hypothetical protein